MSSKGQHFILLALVFFIQTVICENMMDNENSTNEFTVENEESRVLSRRKRFLTFPDGSSLQLVFCCQTSALIPIGDIFLYGNTAALAWSLPSDPQFLDILKYKDKAQRRGDEKSITYIDEKGKIIAKVPYKKRPIVNPAFAKRSIDDEKMTFKEKLKIKMDRMKMHENQLHRNYLKTEHLDKNSIEFHRSNRVELFGKLEKLLTALGKDGRQCILYKLCESGQNSSAQGTFLQEFLRVVFTLPKGDEFDEEFHRQYDEAHTATEDCLALYPGCDNFTASPML